MVCGLSMFALTWMKAVATMTPEPKYFATKNDQFGAPTLGCLTAKTGKHAPSSEPMRMTKMDEIRRAMRPS